MFPQLGPRERTFCEFVDGAQWGTVGEHGQHCATGEIDTDANDGVARSTAFTQRRTHRFSCAVEPIRRVLQCKVCWQLVAWIRRQRVENLPVRISHNGRSTLRAVEIND